MRHWRTLAIGLAAFLLPASTRPRKIVWPPPHPAGPWNNAEAVIIPDPYGGNAFDFDKAFADRKVRAVVFRAAQGLTVDGAVYTRAREAKRRGIPFGIYLLGMASRPWKDAHGKTHAGLDPTAQADLLVKIAHDLGANMMALDIEGLGSPFMSPDEAEKAIERVHAQSRPNRYPVFYANKDTVASYARKYSGQSSFARTQLWLAGLPGYVVNRIWADYDLLQFGAEWDCATFLAQFPKKERPRYANQANCGRYSRYPIQGSRYDLDVNLLHGGAARIQTMFGSPQE